MTDAEIIRNEKERLLASGMSKKDVLRAISGSNRDSIVKAYRDTEETVKKENTDVQTDDKTALLDLKNSKTRKSRKRKSAPKSEPKTVKPEKVNAEVIANDDFTVYDDMFSYYVEEYESNLNAEMKKILYKQSSVAFTGLIKYLRDKIHTRRFIDTVDGLYYAWEMYTKIVYAHNHYPNIDEFAIFLNVQKSTFYTWKDGRVKDDYSEKLTYRRMDVVKRAQDECKLGRYRLAESGSVAGIFFMKAIDGYAETSAVPAFNAEQVTNCIEMTKKLGIKCSDNSDSSPALTAAE